jgi:nucleoid-associated protein YgaU
MSITAACTMALIGLWIVGCQNSKKDSVGAADPSVTELSVPQHAAAPAPQPYVAPAPAPAPAAQPVVYDSAPPANAAAGSAAPGAYTVKKGDTLYSIAKTRYGSGKEYTRIVAANPGLSAEHLKVGQTIQIP